ncbi:Hypothetical protein HVR_LOCUS412 [uncultured virus]|nr:Hypothetical protein HVR_LOCUS412 [uncultured virus]
MNTDITVQDLNRPEVKEWLESLTKFKISYFDYQNDDELQILFNAASNATAIKFEAFESINIKICMDKRITDIFIDATDEVDFTPLLQNKKNLVKATIYGLYIYHYSDIEHFLNNNINTLKYLCLDIYGFSHEDYIKLINKVQRMKCSYKLQMYYSDDEDAEHDAKFLADNYNARMEWSSGGYAGIIVTLPGDRN